MPDALRAIAHELYGLRPEEFTAARTTAEKRVRSEGDRELAAAVKALRRPAVAAWAVNLLVRRRTELVHQVVALGESLREAQAMLQGDALRDLTRQRRQLVTAVTAEAVGLAEAEGQALSEPATRQVEETLQAAMVDPSAAEALLSGLLAQPLSSTGLVSLGDVLAVPGAAPPDPTAPSSAAAARSASEPASRPQLSVVRDDERALDQARARAARAAAAVRAAQKAVDKLGKKRSKAEARVLQLEGELEELRRRVADLEQAGEAAAERLEEIDADLEEAQAMLADAELEATAAAEALERLT